MANKPKRKKVTQLPLIADCRISKSSNAAHHVFPTLTVQLEPLGGEIYEVRYQFELRGACYWRSQDGSRYLKR